MSRLLFAAALCWVSLPLSAQATRTLHGTVSSGESGETVPHALITIRPSGRQTSTNSDGRYVLVGSPTTAVTLVVRALGYRTLEREVPAGTETLRLDLPLDVLPAELAPINIVDESREVIRVEETPSQTTVSPRDLALLPTLGDVDVFRGLQLLPGVSGTAEHTSGLFVRGGTPDQNLVLFDGMTMYQVDHFFGFFSAFNADAIKDIQIYKGGYPAPYGGRVSSVVDMTGRTGDLFRVHGAAGVNLLSGSLMAEVPLGGRGAILVSGRRSYTDIMRSGLYESIYDLLTGDQTGGGPIGAGGARGGPGGQAFQQQQVRPDFYFYDANVRASYRPSNSDFVVLSLYGGRDDLDNSRQTVRTVGPQGTAQRSVFSDVVDVTDWGNLGASIMWSRAWAPRHQTQLQFAGSRYDSDFNRTNATEVVDPQLDSVLNVFSTANVESNRVEDLTARLDHVWDLAAAHRVRLGVWAARQETDYTFTRDTTTLLSTAAQGTRVEFYAEDTWSPSRRFTLTLGGRASRYDATAEWYLEPRLAAGFRVLPNLRIKAAFGEYHQFVNRVVRDNVTQGSRDFWLLADATLIPIQSARHWIAGVTWNAGGTVLDVEAYHRDLSGLSEFSLRFRPTEGFAIEDLFHDGTGVARGLEVLAQRRWGALTGWVSYTLAEVEHTFPTINGGLPFAALHDQRHELKTVASLNLGRFVLSATWAYGSGRPYTSPESQYTITLLDGTEQSYIHVGEKNSQRLPAYHRMDAAIHYRFDIAAGAGRGDISLSAFNVYNRRNVWYREFDLSDTPILITDVNYLGFTPNISFRLEF